MNGVPPFKLHDECYYHLRECGADHGKVDRVLPLHPPASTIQNGISATRGNAIARAAIQKKEEQYCAWTYERPGGGKAFGFTGGHFHWNWARDEVRQMAMNGILWAAGGNVPEKGIVTPRPKAAQMLANMDIKNPGWTEETLQNALDLAQSGTPVPWRKYSNGPLTITSEPEGESQKKGSANIKPTQTKQPAEPTFGRETSKSGITHSILIAGSPTVLVGEDGQVMWQTESRRVP